MTIELSDHSKKIIKRIDFVARTLKDMHGKGVKGITAFALCRELVAKVVVPGQKILDPACGKGSFLLAAIRHLIVSGMSVEDAVNSVHGVDINQLQLRTAHKCILRATGLVPRLECTDSLNWKTNMKFDVVIGNPPFSDSSISDTNSNSSRLYLEFIVKSMDMAVNTVSMITPAAWMSVDKVKNKMVDTGLKSVTRVDPENFPGVRIRSGITAFIVDIGYTGDIDVTSLTSTHHVGRHTALTFGNPHEFALVERIQKSHSIADILSLGKYLVPVGTKGSIDRLLLNVDLYSATSNGKFDVPTMIYTGGTTKPARYLFSNISCVVNKWGVVVPTISDRHIIGAIRLTPPGTGVSDKLKVAYFDTEQEAINVKAYLESSLVRFVARTIKYGNTVNQNNNSFGKIPLIDFTNSYTDSEILDMFELTASDRKLIN